MTIFTPTLPKGQGQLIPIRPPQAPQTNINPLNVLGVVGARQRRRSLDQRDRDLDLRDAWQELQGQIAVGKMQESLLEHIREQGNALFLNNRNESNKRRQSLGSSAAGLDPAFFNGQVSDAMNEYARTLEEAMGLVTTVRNASQMGSAAVQANELIEGAKRRLQNNSYFQNALWNQMEYDRIMGAVDNAVYDGAVKGIGVNRHAEARLNKLMKSVGGTRRLRPAELGNIEKDLIFDKNKEDAKLDALATTLSARKKFQQFRDGTNLVETVSLQNTLEEALQRGGPEVDNDPGLRAYAEAMGTTPMAMLAHKLHSKLTQSRLITDIEAIGKGRSTTTGDTTSAIRNLWPGTTIEANRKIGTALFLQEQGVDLNLAERPGTLMNNVNQIDAAIQDPGIDVFHGIEGDKYVYRGGIGEGGSEIIAEFDLTPERKAEVRRERQRETEEFESTSSFVGPQRAPVNLTLSESEDQALNASGFKDIIDRTESEGGYDALFNYENREGGQFPDVRVSEMTIGELKDFSDTKGPYAQRVLELLREKDPNREKTSTPMGRYQIIGTTLRELADDMNLSDNEVFTPNLQDKMALRIIQDVLKPSDSPSAKREALRDKWEGFIDDVTDEELDRVIGNIENSGLLNASPVSAVSTSPTPPSTLENTTRGGVGVGGILNNVMGIQSDSTAVDTTSTEVVPEFLDTVAQEPVSVQENIGQETQPLSRLEELESRRNVLLEQNSGFTGVDNDVELAKLERQIERERRKDNRGTPKDTIERTERTTEDIIADLELQKEFLRDSNIFDDDISEQTDAIDRQIKKERDKAEKKALKRKKFEERITSAAKSLDMDQDSIYQVLNERSRQIEEHEVSRQRLQQEREQERGLEQLSSQVEFEVRQDKAIDSLLTRLEDSNSVKVTEFKRTDGMKVDKSRTDPPVYRVRFDGETRGPFDEDELIQFFESFSPK